MVYFLSDVHLGLDLPGDLSKDREKRLATTLLEFLGNATELYLLGDIFDYWFEFQNGKHPEYSIFFSVLQKYNEKNIPIYQFCGNHDLWLGSFLSKQFNVHIIKQPLKKTILGKRFYLAHGDGLGKGDFSYKLLKKIFTNSVSISLFGLLPADIGFSIMKYFSARSRNNHGDESFNYASDRLLEFCENHSTMHDFDFYLMGHRHLLLRLPLENNNSEYINLGDWLSYDSYACFDGTTMQVISKTGKPILIEEKLYG